MAIVSEFYKRLRDLCEEKNMTVNELVRFLNLSSGSPTAWKNGTVPRHSTISKIADYFNVSVDYLSGHVGTKKAPAVFGKRSVNDNDIEHVFFRGHEDIANLYHQHPDENIIRIAGRDGSYQERKLTDQQLAALQAILDQMPDVPEGL